MDKKYIGPVMLLLAAVAGLVAMGLVFSWCCPDRLHDVGGDASHWRFKCMVAWNMVGMSAALLAMTAGWRRMLRAAPLVFAGWVALWIVVYIHPVVDGTGTFVRIGPIVLGVWSLFPVALSLLAGWLRERYGIQTKRILLIVAIAALAALAGRVASDADRMTRLAAVLSGNGAPAMTPSACARCFVQSQTRSAFAQAHWFSSTDAEILRSTPGNTTYSMPASAAVLFGKWFVFVMAGLFAAFALGIVWLWRIAEDGARKAFILVFGPGVAIPAAFGICQCLGLVPMAYMSVPLASCDTTAVLATWLGIGILVSRNCFCQSASNNYLV